MNFKKVILLLPVLFLIACTNHKRLTNALAPGMTKEEVVRIMGNPDYKKIDGKKERYCYQKECRYEGGVQIQFDENGLLQETW